MGGDEHSMSKTSTKLQKNYQDFIESFMDYTSKVEAPEQFLRWSAISIVAGALERKVWINFKNQKMIFPNLYVMLVGKAGTARKSYSSSFAHEIITKVEDIAQMSTSFTTAALIEQLIRSGDSHSIEVAGFPFKQSSLYCYTSEAINTIKDKEGSIIQMLTDLYDCGPSGWNRHTAWVHETKGEGPRKVFNPCINFLGCSTPTWLLESIGKKNMQGGFSSRIIFVVQKGSIARNFGWDEESGCKEDMKNKLIQDLYEINGVTGELITSREYKDLFIELDRQNQQKCFEIEDGDPLESYYARKPIQILKVSQALHVAQMQDRKETVSADVLQNAINLIEELEKDMLSLFENVEVDEVTLLAKKLWERVLLNSGVRNGQRISIIMMRRWYPNRNQDTVTKAVQHLINLGLLKDPRYLNDTIWYEADSSKVL